MRVAAVVVTVLTSNSRRVGHRAGHPQPTSSSVGHVGQLLYRRCRRFHPRHRGAKRLHAGRFSLDARAEPAIVRYRFDGKHLLVGCRSEPCVTIFDVATGRAVVRLPLPVAPRNFCFNNDGGQLFISGDGMDAVAIVFPYTTEVGETILAGHAPDAMAARGKSPFYLLIASPENGRIMAFDIETRKLVAVVEVGLDPRHILMTPDDEYALVLNQGSGDLAVIRMLSIGTGERREPISSSSRRAFCAESTTLFTSGSKPRTTPACRAMPAASRMQAAMSCQAAGKSLSGWRRHMLSRSRVPVHR